MLPVNLSIEQTRCSNYQIQKPHYYQGVRRASAAYVLKDPVYQIVNNTEKSIMLFIWGYSEG